VPLVRLPGAIAAFGVRAVQCHLQDGVLISTVPYHFAVFGDRLPLSVTVAPFARPGCTMLQRRVAKGSPLRS
jgi:hypothetical protein